MSDRSVFIIAGESSGEIYGARLAAELKSRYPDTRISGVGGSRMREAGVELVAGITSAIGLVEIIRKYGELKRTLNAAIQALTRNKPDVLVLIDYPDFNFRVAKKARAMGIKVLYYVTPQVWAWRKGRVHQMAKLIDRAAVILPFEEKLLRDAGINAEFVGHPIAGDMRSKVLPMQEAKDELGLEQTRDYIALLPGSRDSELSRLLPIMLESVKLFNSRYPGYEFILSIAPNIERHKYSEQIAQFEQEGVKVMGDDIALLYAASRAGVVASGTAAFQAVFTGTPIAVIYKVAWLTYFIMNKLVDLKYFNLANMILDKEALRELLQDDATAEKICSELNSMLVDSEKSERIKSDLKEVRLMFQDRRPTERVVSIIEEMAGWAG